MPGFLYNKKAPYENFDGIILTFQKGKTCWPESDASLTFRTMGDYDYFSVTPVALPDNANTSGEFLSNLKEPLKSKRKSDEEDTNYHLFGISASPNSNKFWQTESMYTFVSLIQFGDGVVKIGDKIDDIKKHLGRSKVEHKIYYSLDIGDFFIFYKTSEAHEGRKIILDLIKKQTPKMYSYSVMGFDEVRLMASGKNEPVHKLMICSTIRSYPKFDKWIAKWKELFGLDKVKVHERIGHEGFSMNVYELNMKDIGKALHEGLLSPNLFIAGGYKDVIMRPRVIIDSDYKISNEKGTKLDDNETILDTYRKVRDEKNINRHMRDCMDDAIWEMFKAVSMLEKNCFAQDIVKFVKSSYNGFIEELVKENERIDKAFGNESAPTGQSSKINENHYNQLAVNGLNLHENVRKYLDANLSFIQGAIHVERMFFQVPGFKIRLYDAQPKLVIFYLSYLRKLIDILDDGPESKRYEFVINIGLHDEMSVEKLFNSNKSDKPNDGRLLVIRIPMSSLFAPQNLMPQLIHEIAHVCADRCRCRNERKTEIVHLLCRLLAQWMFNFEDEYYEWIKTDQHKIKVAYNKIFQTEDQFKAVISFIYKYLKKYLNEELKELNDDESLRIENLESRLKEVIINFFAPLRLEEFIPKLYNSIIKSRNPEQEKDEDFIMMVNVFVQMLYARAKDIHSDRYPFGHVCRLFDESYSDYVMLKISCIPPEDYIRLFIKFIDKFYKENVNSSYGDSLKPDFNYQRILSVFQVCYKMEMTNFLDGFISKHPDDSEMLCFDKFNKKIKDMLLCAPRLHATITQRLISYLEACDEKWGKKYGNPAKRGPLQPLYNTFNKVVNSPNLTEFWDALHVNYKDFIDKY